MENVSNPQIEIKIELIPIIRQDKKTGQFVANFSKFPRAIASGNTKDEALSELLHVFSDMLKEKEQEITAEIINEYRASQSPRRNHSERLTGVRVYA
jgi:predicted RNase H-like HicB family nuclease